MDKSRLHPSGLSWSAIWKPIFSANLAAVFFGAGMDIIINGKNVSADFTTVEKLLESEDLDPKLVVVELNGKIMPAEEYSSRQLKTGDVVEIVQFVAGG